MVEPLKMVHNDKDVHLADSIVNIFILLRVKFITQVYYAIIESVKRRNAQRKNI